MHAPKAIKQDWIKDSSTPKATSKPKAETRILSLRESMTVKSPPGFMHLETSQQHHEIVVTLA